MAMYKTNVELSIYCESGHGSDGFFIAIFTKEVELEDSPMVGDSLTLTYIVAKDVNDVNRRHEPYRKPRVLKIEKIYSKPNGEPLLVFVYDRGKTAEEFDSLREAYVTHHGFKKDYTPSCYRIEGFRPDAKERESQALRLTDLFEQIRTLAPADSFFSPPTESDINAAEDAMQVIIPADYRRFIKEFGASSWPSPMCGVGAEVSWDLILADAVQAARSYERKPLPDHLLPFSPFGKHDYYCFDLSRMSDGECPIVYWKPNQSSSSPSDCFVSFVDWLELMIARCT